VIWTTWRQHRAEAGVCAVILAGLVAAMVVVGSIARNRATALGLPGCRAANGDCTNALDALHRDFHSIPPFTAALVAFPLLAGMFLAAPLLSREYEAGTHRLAWTQSVSPLRWITVKLVLIFGTLAAAALVLGLLATWTLDPLTAAFGGRYNSTWFDTQGLVPVACMLFALAVGVAASAVIRRTIPAMAVTLLVYAAARIPIHWIRGNFWPATTHAYTVAGSTLLQHPIRPLSTYLPTLPQGDWIQTVTVIDSTGHRYSSNAGSLDVLSRYCAGLRPGPVAGDPAPPDPAAVAACKPTVAHLSLHETITYQPAAHFWPIQTVETAIFLALAALFVTVAVLSVVRHRPT
jgi:hypothetical protein